MYGTKPVFAPVDQHAVNFMPLLACCRLRSLRPLWQAGGRPGLFQLWRGIHPAPQKAGLDRPDGHVDFVLFIGMTDAELRTLADGRHDVRELYGKYDSDLTDYQRNSLC